MNKRATIHFDDDCEPLALKRGRLSAVPTDECRGRAFCIKRARDEELELRHHVKRGPAALEHDEDSPFVPRRAFRFEAEVALTPAQVRAVVEGAVRDRELELRDEYDALLADRLDEQWRVFAKYNESHVHARMQRSEYDYFS